MPFQDRQEAGQRLAQALGRFRDQHPVVMALPRGGVPVAVAVSQTLQAPLDVVIARKIGAPGQPEFGIGAIAPGNVRILDERTLGLFGFRAEQLAPTMAHERHELARRERLFRGDRPYPDLSGRTVILVDDGLATGVTARAAIAFLRKLQPARLVLAVPVGAPETVAAMRPLVDELVCLETPASFGAVGAWYRNFAQTTDEEVIRLLREANRDVA